MYALAIHHRSAGPRPAEPAARSAVAPSEAGSPAEFQSPCASSPLSRTAAAGFTAPDPAATPSTDTSRANPGAPERGVGGLSDPIPGQAAASLADSRRGLTIVAPPPDPGPSLTACDLLELTPDARAVIRAQVGALQRLARDIDVAFDGYTPLPRAVSAQGFAEAAASQAMALSDTIAAALLAHEQAKAARERAEEAARG